MSQLARFVCAGFANTLVGLVTILAALRSGFSDYTANALGYGVGIIYSYLLNRRFTFGVRTGLHRRQLPRFLASALVCYALNLAVIYGGNRLNLSGNLGVQWLGLAVYSVSFFALSRWYVFGSSTR